MFPAVQHQFTQTVLLKSYFLGIYLGISSSGGHPSLITKNLDDKNDPELLFLSYFYKTAEATETKLILLLHESSGTFFRMTDDKRLQVQTKDEMENFIDAPVHPRNITRADNRFFYLKNADAANSNFILEAMNGKDYGYLVVVKGEGKAPELQFAPDRNNIPMEAYFEMQDPHNYHD